MAALTLKDQIQAVLGRTVAEAKSRGSPNQKLEATALMESIALTLLLHPRAALYFLLLARNGLLNVIGEELAAIAALSLTVQDLNNPAYTIDGTDVLQRARTTLLQLESLDRVSAASPIFGRFDSAVDEFLKTKLAKSVRKSGTTVLVRPAAEAKASLNGDFSTLKTLHADLLDRFYALVVGLDNFLLSPISTILGLTTATRARMDIEHMIEDLANDNSSVNARNMAITLIANRAAIRSIGSAPSPVDVLISSTKPPGYQLTATSDPTPAVFQGAVPGPFTFGTAAALTGQTKAGSRPFSNFPQSTLDLKDQAHTASAAGVSYPVTIPAGSGLYITITKNDGTTVSYNVALSGSTTLAAAISAINTALGTDGGAVEYIKAGSGRILVFAKTPNVGISVDPTFLDPNGAGLGLPAPLTKSAHTLLGFIAGPGSVLGSTPVATVVDGLNLLFGDLFSTLPNVTGLLLTGLDTTVGAFLTFSGTAATVLGIVGTFKATSAVFRLRGTIFGVTTDPVDPRTLLEPGDQVALSTGIGVVLALSLTRITLATALPTFDEIPVANSAVVLAWQALIVKVVGVLTTWKTNGYQSDLSKIDKLLAPLGGSTAPAQINAAVAGLADLSVQVTLMQTALSDSITLLATNAAGEERGIAQSVVSSLEERKFDRAVDLLLRGKIQEALDVDHDTASFAGAFLRAASDLSQRDFVFPNTAQDEGLQPRATTDRTGLS